MSSLFWSSFCRPYITTSQAFEPIVADTLNQLIVLDDNIESGKSTVDVRVELQQLKNKLTNLHTAARNNDEDFLRMKHFMELAEEHFVKQTEEKSDSKIR